MRKNWIWIAPALLIAALSVPVLDSTVQLHYRDAGRFQYPSKQLIAERFHRGELPFWNPWAEAGESVTSQLDMALWHPTTLLYAVLPLDLAFKLQHLSALLVALWGMYALTRRLGASREAAVAAATGFCGSGYLVSMVSSNLLFALGLSVLPLALERLLAFLQDRRPIALLGGSLALACCTLGGDVQAMLLGGYLGLAGALYWGMHRGKKLQAFWMTALWGTCALVLALPAVLPVIPRFLASSRTAGQAGAVDDFAFKPLRLTGLVLPWAFDDDLEEGERSTYNEYLQGLEPEAFVDSIVLGAPILLLALASGKRARPLVIGAAVLLICACGSALWAGKLFYAGVPGMRLFRYPEKLAAPATLLLCAAAALGVGEAARDPRKFARLAFAAAGVLTLAALVIPLIHLHGRTGDPALTARFHASVRAGGAAEAVLCVLLALAVRRPAWLSPLCAAGSYLALHSAISLAPIEALHGPFPLAEQLQKEAGPSAGNWRVYTEGSEVLGLAGLNPRIMGTVGGARTLLPNYNLLARIENVLPYSSLTDRDYDRAFRAAPHAMALLLGVRYVLRPAQSEARPGYTRGAFGIWERRWPEQPRAFTLPCARTEADAGDIVRELVKPGFDPHRAAFVRKRVQLPDTCTGPTAAVPVVRPMPEQMSMETSAATPSLLVVAEHFEAGWSATIDGLAAEVLQVDLGAQGVVLPAGKHTVALRFSPPHLALGVLLSLACALLLIGLELFTARARSGPGGLPAAAPAASGTSAPPP